MSETVFEHDGCPSCVYLGPFGDEGSVTADLWFCPQGGWPTVIGRYGDKPAEYESGLPFAEVGVPWAVEAKLRAVNRGLL